MVYLATITGAIRISFGYMSTRADADAFLQFVTTYFVTGSTVLFPSINSSTLSSAAIVDLHNVASANSSASLTHTDTAPAIAVSVSNVDADSNADAAAAAASDSHTEADADADDEIRISALCVYPVKSCGAIHASEWPLGPRGFLFDREWSIVGARSERDLQFKRMVTTPRVFLLRQIVLHRFKLRIPSFFHSRSLCWV